MVVVPCEQDTVRHKAYNSELLVISNCTRLRWCPFDRSSNVYSISICGSVDYLLVQLDREVPSLCGKPLAGALQ